MGGNLLSTFNLPLKRIPQEDYELLIQKLSFAVGLKSGNRRVRPLLCFTDKKTHGDLDLLIEQFPGENDWMEFCENLAGCKPHKNGHTISFPMWGYQIDFNFAAPEIYESAYNYYAYESGMLIGVLANNLGCKYGHDGLHLKLPLSELNPEWPANEFREILLTRDTKEIFGLFGLDYVRFQQGFVNQIEFFDWFCKSKYFVKSLWVDLDPLLLEK